jgi:hypothetical protein
MQKIFPGDADPDIYQQKLNEYRNKAALIPGVTDAEIENAKQMQQYGTLANAVSKLVSSAGSFQGQQAKPMDFSEYGESGMRDVALKRQQQQDKLKLLDSEYGKDLQAQQAKDSAIAGKAAARRQAEMDQFNREKQKQELAKGNYTPGQKKLDEDFAKEYNDWTSGYRSEAEKNLALLRKSAEILKKSSLVSGRAYGLVPNALQPEIAKIVKQDVQSAAQASLKAILGTQFTEKEGERIMAASFDPELSEEANLDKVMRTIKELEERMANKNAKARIFESEGSLRNYRMIYNHPDPEPDEKQTSPTAGGETKVINGQKYRKVQGGWEVVN